MFKSGEIKYYLVQYVEKIHYDNENKYDKLKEKIKRAYKKNIQW